MLLLAAALTTAACGGGGTSLAETDPGPADAASRAESGALVARQGSFERRVDLTGSLEAARAVYLQVPRTPNWQVDLRWMEEDGASVRAGETVVELDDSSFANDLDNKETALAEQLAELERRRAEVLGETRQKEFEVARREADLAKARLEAELPEGIVPRQELEERRLALDRARIELEKAEADLAAHRRGSAADLEVSQIEIRKARREIELARAAIRELKLTTPVDGVFLRAKHPWHGRTLQIGDTAWVGMTIASLPDLASLVVEARLPDVDDGDVEPGMPAVVHLDAYPGEVFRGTVRTVAPVAQEESGGSTRRFFETIVELEGLDRLDPAERERLIPGMSARVEVVAERLEEALLVPRRALEAVGLATDADTARVRLADGAFAEVEIGTCNAFDCVVEASGAGLEAGTRLALAAAGVPGGVR